MCRKYTIPVVFVLLRTGSLHFKANKDLEARDGDTVWLSVTFMKHHLLLSIKGTLVVVGMIPISWYLLI